MLVTAVPLCTAQLFDLATTTDGRDLYVASTYRLQGAAATSRPSWWASIYRVRADAWTLAADGGDTGGLGRPFLSGDGRIQGWERSFPCVSCFFAGPPSESQFIGLDQSSIKIPRFKNVLSPNGRYLATPGYFVGIKPAVQDLITGETFEPQIAFTFGGIQVANDGTLVGIPRLNSPAVSGPVSVLRWRPGRGVEEVLQGEYVVGLTLAGEGRYAILETGLSTQRQLWLIDFDTRQKRAVSPVREVRDSTPPAKVNISDDGSRALYFWQEQSLSLWQSSDSGAMGEALPGLAPDEIVRAAVLSGDGRVAWAHTKENRLLRFDLDRQTSEEVLGEFPSSLSFSHGSPVPGSALTLAGGRRVAGQFVRANGFEFPLLPTERRDQTIIQMPWEFPISNFTATIGKEGYPFELSVNIFSSRASVAPQFEYTDAPARLIKAASQDFSHLIDRNNPASPGETVHVWLTGLGPLDRPVATGVPGPFDPPSHPLAPLGCAMFGVGNTNPSWTGVALPFVAYAPGLAGFFQVDITIPPDWPAGTFQVACYSGTARTDGFLEVGASK